MTDGQPWAEILADPWTGAAVGYGVVHALTDVAGKAIKRLDAPELRLLALAFAAAWAVLLGNSAAWEPAIVAAVAVGSWSPALLPWARKRLAEGPLPTFLAILAILAVAAPLCLLPGCQRALVCGDKPLRLDHSRAEGVAWAQCGMDEATRIEIGSGAAPGESWFVCGAGAAPAVVRSEARECSGGPCSAHLMECRGGDRL